MNRDFSNFLQNRLEIPALSGFDNLLLPSQKSRYLQRKINPFRIILQVFGHISAQYQDDVVWWGVATHAARESSGEIYAC